MVTLKDIARICEVSPSTVSNVLNGKNSMSDEVKQRVLEVVRDTGYRPNIFARNMRTSRSGTVGIIVEDLCQFSSPIITEMLLEYLEQHGYHPILMNMRMYYKLKNSDFSKEENLCEILYPVINQLDSIKVEGVIYVAAHCRELRLIPELIKYPAVYTYAFADPGKYKSVITDDETAAYDMINYLFSKGHRKIGIIAGDPENYHTVNRLKGLEKAYSNAGFAFDRSFLVNGEWDRSSGYTQAKKILKEDITALWCMNDRMASGAYGAALEYGMEIGKDIAICGFDNQELSSCLFPKLTTYEIPLYAIGYSAAQNLVDLLDVKDKAEITGDIVKFKGKVLARESA